MLFNHKSVRRFIPTLVISGALLVGTPGISYATVSQISGSTYSSADVWYTSANYRTITNDEGGQVKVYISNFPSLSNGNPDQLKWQTVNGSATSSVTYIGSSYGYYTVGSWSAGVQFRNKYARYTTCNNCDHYFEGSIAY